MIFLALVATGCTRSTPLESSRLDCDGGVRVFAQNTGHCVYERSEAPDPCDEAIPHRYETMNDVVCSESDDLSDEWLATIIEASFYQDAGPSDVPNSGSDSEVSEPETDSGVPLEVDATLTGVVVDPAAMDTP